MGILSPRQVDASQQRLPRRAGCRGARRLARPPRLRSAVGPGWTGGELSTSAPGRFRGARGACAAGRGARPAAAAAPRARAAARPPPLPPSPPPRAPRACRARRQLCDLEHAVIALMRIAQLAAGRGSNSSAPAHGLTCRATDDRSPLDTRQLARRARFAHAAARPGRAARHAPRHASAAAARGGARLADAAQQAPDQCLRLRRQRRRRRPPRALGRAARAARRAIARRGRARVPLAPRHA